MSINWKEKYLEITSSFLNDLLANPEQTIERLGFYVENRNSLLKIIAINDNGLNFSQKNYSENYSENNTEFINKLVELENKIIAILEKNKQECSTQIASLLKSQNAISGYHSTKNYSKFLDKKL